MATRTQVLPEIVAVEAARVRYREPRIYFEGPEQRQAREAVEITVETAAPWPALDVPPVLFVGEVPLAEFETAARNRYRFFSFQPGRLEPGAAVAVGWPHSPERKVPTRFRFAPQPPAIA